MRYLKLTVEEDDGTVNQTYMAKTPIVGSPWDAIKFFSEFLIREWHGIIRGSR